jgi:hypothetical protein
MWMNESPVALSLLTKRDYLEEFISQITDEEYDFFKDILRNIFVLGMFYLIILDPNRRIKTDKLLRKLKKEIKLYK